MRRLVLLLSIFLLAAPGETLTGMVVDESGVPVEGARVRLRAAEAVVITGADGRFVLADPASAPGGEITAARPGHIIGGTTLKAGIFDYRIQLAPIPAGDDATYPWVTAIPEDDQAPRTDFGREPCGACHRRILAEWQDSAHARAATNARFLAFFDGRNGLSFKRSNPVASEGCGNCHSPMAPGEDPRQATGVGAEGVGCDLCHKVADARPGEGDRTGIRAVDLRRPPFGRQTIFGPFDDVPRGRDVFAPVFSESRYCAACHQQRVKDVPIYSEFEEWQKSKYAAIGVTCQSCHMRSEGQATTMSDLGPGRIERAPATLSSHRFHDSRSPGLLEPSIGLSLAARIEGDAVIAESEVANLGAGHHLPAGSPMRHMLLLVSAETEGTALSMTEGPALPEWSGDSVGKPGRGFAKLLGDSDRRAPVPPWQATTLAEDTRIPAGGTDRSRYRFALPQAGAVRVSATLLIRRTFPAWATTAGTDAGDIVVARKSVLIAR